MKITSQQSFQPTPIKTSPLQTTATPPTPIQYWMICSLTMNETFRITLLTPRRLLYSLQTQGSARLGLLLNLKISFLGFVFTAKVATGSTADTLKLWKNLLNDPYFKHNKSGN
jgi:hypothetical protein